MSGWVWWAVGAGLALALFLCRRPLAALCRLVLRSGLGIAFLWLLQGLGGVLGATPGVNLLNGLVLGALGLPGFALLLLTRWTGG